MPVFLSHLANSLRPAPADYEQQRKTVWTTGHGLFFVTLSKEDKIRLAKLCNPDMRPADEALMRLLTARPDLALRMQVPAVLIKTAIAVEGGNAALQRAATDLLGAEVDLTLGARAQLFAKNGLVQQTVQGLIDGAPSWQEGQQIRVQWTSVSLMENWTTEKGSNTRAASQAQAAELGKKTGALGLSQQDLADLDMLQQYAQMPLSAPGASATPAPAAGHGHTATGHTATGHGHAKAPAAPPPMAPLPVRGPGAAANLLPAAQQRGRRSRKRS